MLGDELTLLLIPLREVFELVGCFEWSNFHLQNICMANQVRFSSGKRGNPLRYNQPIRSPSTLLWESKQWKSCNRILKLRRFKKNSPRTYGIQKSKFLKIFEV